MDLVMVETGPAAVIEPGRFRTLAAAQDAIQQGRAVQEEPPR